MSEFVERIVDAVLDSMGTYEFDNPLEFVNPLHYTTAVERVQDILTRKDGGVNGVKYMDLEEFGSEGYLQEVNRLFFHPLGLALEITCDSSDDPEANTYPNAVITGIWDYRDDPEGMIFGNFDGFGGNKEKAAKVYAERAKHFRTRASLFGFDTDVFDRAFKDDQAVRHQLEHEHLDVEPLDWVYPEDRDGS